MNPGLSHGTIDGGGVAYAEAGRVSDAERGYSRRHVRVGDRDGAANGLPGTGALNGNGHVRTTGHIDGGPVWGRAAAPQHDTTGSDMQSGAATECARGKKDGARIPFASGLRPETASRAALIAAVSSCPEGLTVCTTCTTGRATPPPLYPAKEKSMIRSPFGRALYASLPSGPTKTHWLVWPGALLAVPHTAAIRMPTNRAPLILRVESR